MRLLCPELLFLIGMANPAGWHGTSCNPSLSRRVQPLPNVENNSHQSYIRLLPPPAPVVSDGHSWAGLPDTERQ